MEVRLADMDRDLLGIMDGAREFISRLGCPESVPGDDDELIEAVCRILALPGMETVVAEHDGEIVGGIGILYGPALWRPRVTCATELFIWAHRDAPHSTVLRLIRFVQARMTHYGVGLREFMRLPTSPDSIDKVYTAMGLRKAQEMWVG